MCYLLFFFSEPNEPEDEDEEPPMLLVPAAENARGFSHAVRSGSLVCRPSDIGAVPNAAAKSYWIPFKSKYVNFLGTNVFLVPRIIKNLELIS